MNETNKQSTINQRQRLILNQIASYDGLSRLEIQKLIKKFYPISKPTLIRDLNVLITKKLILTKGKGKNCRYFSTHNHPLLKKFDLDLYFQLEPDQRVKAKNRFDFKIFSYLKNLFDKEGIDYITKIKKSFSKMEKTLAPDILKREIERFTIELAWKSSKIEGNTYTLLETETLIKEKQPAPGKTKEETIMILNHKNAFEIILKNRNDFKKLSLSLINQLHNFMIKNLSISTGIRKQPVGITGTIYRPLDNQHQITEAMKKLIEVVNNINHPLEKALIISTMIPYIQPYADGNKRTSRMLTNALLLAYDYYPLSYRSVNEQELKKALIIFYEQNSLYHLKKIFLDQLIFAYNNYFLQK